MRSPYSKVKAYSRYARGRRRNTKQKGLIV